MGAPLAPPRRLVQRGAPMPSSLSLNPVAEVRPEQLAAGKRALVMDAAWASATGALSGGVVLLAYALLLGAAPMQIGLLAAIPFMAQAAQLPAIVVVERIRERKRFGVASLTVARLMMLTMAALPYVVPPQHRLWLLILANLAISVLGAMASCAINSWFHQLLPAEGLGAFFSKRLFVASIVGCICILSAGVLVDHPPGGDALNAYAVIFSAAALAGLASSYCLARTPEPAMAPARRRASLRSLLRMPLQDRGFRGLLVLLAAWNLATNFAAPFLAVYLLEQLHYSLSTVTTLWVTSQLANALTLYLWGPVSDRLSNRAVLAVALPAYFLCTIGLVFTGLADTAVQLVLLYLVHAVMGAASGGIALATGNLSLKLAPREHGTAYLAATGVVSSIAGGLAPIAGGAMAQWFASAQLAVVIRWTSVSGSNEFSVASFAHWEFLFGISAVLGLYAIHAVSRVREGGDYSERVVIQELALEALRTVNQLSSIGGAVGGMFAFDRLARALLRRRPRKTRRNRIRQLLLAPYVFRRRRARRAASHARP
ncbi:hypothetical protein CAL14_10305 [Bordetella genomosp. 9]|nr:hypothetical protein CAL14_10305 [Bordetella genomosp. 9]